MVTALLLEAPLCRVTRAVHVQVPVKMRCVSRFLAETQMCLPNVLLLPVPTPPQEHFLTCLSRLKCPQLEETQNVSSFAFKPFHENVRFNSIIKSSSWPKLQLGCLRLVVVWFLQQKEEEEEELLPQLDRKHPTSQLQQVLEAHQRLLHFLLLQLELQPLKIVQEAVRQHLSQLQREVLLQQHLSQLQREVLLQQARLQLVNKQARAEAVVFLQGSLRGLQRLALV